VDRDGVVYVSLDVSGITLPEIFEAQALGYPLRFTNQDVVFDNIQGFLMQRLVSPAGYAATKGKTAPLQGNVVAMPGMFVYPEPAASGNSDKLHYSRHEFVTYFLQHEERLPHAEAGELLGIRLLDHIVLGHDRYTSLQEEGYLPPWPAVLG
jgi:hypothetical protein